VNRVDDELQIGCGRHAARPATARHRVAAVKPTRKDNHA
jgi:hypothetical protein